MISEFSVIVALTSRGLVQADSHGDPGVTLRAKLTLVRNESIVTIDLIGDVVTIVNCEVGM